MRGDLADRDQEVTGRDPRVSTITPVDYVMGAELVEQAEQRDDERVKRHAPTSPPAAGSRFDGTPSIHMGLNPFDVSEPSWNMPRWGNASRTWHL